jgi:hypothetical protein
MLATRLSICLAVLASATPAFGAQFFIILDSTTNRCTITDQIPAALLPGVSDSLPNNPPYPTVSSGTPSPASTTTMLVGDGAYGDRLAAERDLRAIAACAGNW